MNFPHLNQIRVFKTLLFSFCLLLILGISLMGKPIQLKSYTVSGSHLTGYLPVDQQVYWALNRPICHSGQSLIVPAAFTFENLSVVGASIDWGKIVNPKISPELSGFCVIESQKPHILSLAQLNQGQFNRLSKQQTSVFQQDLLVFQGKPIPISQASAINLWRALVIFSDRFEVVENDIKMRRDEFQMALLKLGAQQAIYLDMGTWSEGAYFSSQNRVVKIGKMRKNTHKQSNWLVFH